MTTPDPHQSTPDRPAAPAAPSWGEDNDKTTVYHPGDPYQGSAAASVPGPASGPINPDPATMISAPVESSYSYGYGAPAYSAEPALPAAPDSGATSVYPPAAAPPYAPAGYPQPYAAPAVVPPPPGAMGTAPSPGSRAGAGFASAFIGFVLCGAGVYLLAKFGFDASASYALNFKPNIAKVSVAALGGLLLLAAAILNAWSMWSTMIPGVLLTALGAYGMFVTSGLRDVGRLTRFVLKRNELVSMTSIGFTLAAGMVLLGASIGAAVARSAGRRSAGAG